MHEGTNAIARMPTRVRQLEYVERRLRGGELEHAPHTKKAIVGLLRQAAAELQAAAVQVLIVSQSIDNAGGVIDTRKAGDDGADALASVLRTLKGE